MIVAICVKITLFPCAVRIDQWLRYYKGQRLVDYLCSSEILFAAFQAKACHRSLRLSPAKEWIDISKHSQLAARSSDRSGDPYSPSDRSGDIQTKGKANDTALFST